MTREPTLRELADEKGVTIGAGGLSAQSFRTYPDDPRVPQTVTREFNAITPGEELKMGPLRPDRKTYDFEDADAVVNFGVENGLTVRGHTLVWHSQTPEWFLPWEYTDEQIETFLRDHVHTVAGRYREKVDVWDVVNEPMASDGSLRESAWYEAMGEGYIDRAFEWANDVAPDADLYLNDYGMDEVNEKADGMYDLVQRLLDRGVPIDGVGLQMHAIRSSPDPDSVVENVSRFKELGVDVHVTEMDVAYTPDAKPDDHLEHQAQYYADILEACLDSGCDTLVVWGVHDGNSWVPHYFPEVTDDPLLFDENMDPKPAYFAIRDVLENRE